MSGRRPGSFRALWGVLLLLIAPPSARGEVPKLPEPPHWTFFARSAALSGLAPGSKVIWFSISRDFYDYGLSIRFRNGTVSDLDNDGQERIEIDRDLASASIWAAVDIATGAFALDTPSGRPIDPVAIRGNPRSALRRIDFENREYLYVFLVRPGTGAWWARIGDGGPEDDADDLDYMHARFCSPVTGRFLSVDPSPRSIILAMPQSWNRYSYTVGNPLKYVDPYGELWFQVDGKWVFKKGENETTTYSNDEDGNVVVTVVAGLRRFVTFDGGSLVLYNEDGKTKSLEAQSGRLDDNGNTQPNLQGKEGVGPIPEGKYYFNPATVQNYDDLSAAQKSASLLRRGEWPGGTIAWGQQRVELKPDPSTDTRGRGHFFIHGGLVPGSAGCIDLCDHAGDFFNAVGNSGAEIPVLVDYP